MSDIAIKVQNLSKQYLIGEKVQPYDRMIRDLLLNFLPHRSKAKQNGNTIWALKDISFEVKKGEILGIIGRNGAGKSTLLKVLSRITEPTKGYAEIYGRVGSLLEVGTGFHPELTGRENIYLNAAILGMKRREIHKKFDAIVSFAEVEKFIDTPVKHYSSGMYIRLAFAVAAHLEPEILVVDEVLAVGDYQFQKKCFGKMGEVGKQGKTVLLVSHNMPSIINLCQHAILLSTGEKLCEGSAEEVVRTYLATTKLAAGQVHWDDLGQAPGNEVVRLQTVRILQEGIQGSTEDVDISKEVCIEMEYFVLKENAPLYSAIWLRDHMGTPVLASGNSPSVSLTSDEWYGKPHPRGSYKTICRIPGNFLNEGRYSIAAILGTVPSNTIVLEDNAVSFQVHDTGEMRKEFYGYWIGTVRPKLAWETRFLESENREMKHVG